MRLLSRDRAAPACGGHRDIQPDLLLLAILQAQIKYTKYAMCGDFLELAQASERPTRTFGQTMAPGKRSVMM
jgi:hypothetical protein